MRIVPQGGVAVNGNRLLGRGTLPVSKVSIIRTHSLRMSLENTRILVVMPSAPVQGMERSNLQIMKMLRERGADILFISERTYGAKLQKEIEAINCRWVTAKCDKILHLPKGWQDGKDILRAWVKTAREFRSICNNYQPSHIHIANITYFLYALPMIIRARQKVIFRLPNPPDIHLTPFKQVISNIIWRYLIAPFTDVLICNSRFTLLQLKKIGVNVKKARVIYNCLSERPENAAKDAPDVNSDHFNIVYLGRIRLEKGVKELFEVAKQVVRERDDVSFHFAGEHHWENPFAEKLINEIRENKLESRIKFYGEIQDVFGLLAKCDLHILPSLPSTHESFPNVVLEAKSQSVPSVVFPTNGVPEAVTHLVDGYLCPEMSVEALKNGVIHFLDNPAACNSAGIAAKKSLARFSQNIIAEQWVEVFTDAPN